MSDNQDVFKNWTIYLYYMMYSEQVEAKWGMMADIKFVPYKQYWMD